MSGATFNNPTPQFGTAEYAGKPGNQHCQFCHQPIGGTFYHVNGAMTCPSCADKAKGQQGNDNHAIFTRALIFGIGAAFLGFALFAAFVIITKISIGYAALAVGWLVGTAIVKGSGGMLTRRYQIAAVVLTYLAVALARVPVWIYFAPAEQHDELMSAIPSMAIKALLFPLTRFQNDPVGGAIGLVILFAGLSIAARLTKPKPIAIDGPFGNTPSALA